MGTKVGLTGITFGDASVQNTAAVTGVTSLTAGSGISLSGSTGAVTVTNSAQGATYSAGNGLSLSSTTFSVAAPTHNSIGSYCFVQSGSNSWQSGGTTYTFGSNYAVGNGRNQLGLSNANDNVVDTSSISGTWKWMNSTGIANGCATTTKGIAVRVS